MKYIKYKQKLLKSLLWYLIDLTGDKYGFIYELYVMPKFRKQGYGKQLITFAKQHFKQLGYDKVRLNVYVGNEAQQLYKSCGFEERNITMQLKL